LFSKHTPNGLALGRETHGPRAFFALEAFGKRPSGFLFPENLILFILVEYKVTL
jgi:hypothetical protein